MADTKDKAITTENAVKNAPDPKEVRKAQAEYKGNQHSDLVEVEIIKDGDYLKKGQKKIVHPTMAAILKAKGLIEGNGKPYERPKFEQKDITVDA